VMLCMFYPTVVAEHCALGACMSVNEVHQIDAEHLSYPALRHDVRRMVAGS
jgi:hypothetical protein